MTSGIAELGGAQAGLLVGMGDGVAGLLQAELGDEGGEALAVLGEVDGVGRGAEDRDAGIVEGGGDLEGSLAAELDDDAVERACLLLDAEDLHDVLKGEGLEIEAVGGVVIGGDRLRVAVDHDGLVAGIAEREAGVAAAIVELDALADAVGTAAEDDDLAGVGGPGFAFGLAHDGGLVGRIHVGRLRLELGGAGVDALELGGDAEIEAGAADIVFGAAGKGREAGVGEAVLLEARGGGPPRRGGRSLATSASKSMISLMRARNHGSKDVTERMSSSGGPDAWPER